jgi:hypothetical protein
MDCPAKRGALLLLPLPPVSSPSVGVMTILNVGDVAKVWFGSSAGTEGVVAEKSGPWVVLRTVGGKEVRGHTATMEPVEAWEAKPYRGTMLT